MVKYPTSDKNKITLKKIILPLFQTHITDQGKKLKPHT